MKSLKALRRNKVHIFYLHAPDRSVPIEDTLREINDLYHEGYLYAFLLCIAPVLSQYFSEEFGLSNYNSWEVYNDLWISFKHDSSIHPGS
jgi:aflatoxin B1 aldehyde reductase